MAYASSKATAHTLIGKRVELPVHYDAWMMGARFGVVTSTGHKVSDYVCVKTDNPRLKRRVKVWRIDWDYMKLID